MDLPPQIDPYLAAIEINAIRVAEIATLRQRCLVLEALLDLPADELDRLVRLIKSTATGNRPSQW